MQREHLLARLLRALSGKSQERISEEIGLHPSHVAQFELGLVMPAPKHLERLAAGAGITLREAEEILSLYEAFRRSPRQRGRSAGEPLDRLVEGVRIHTGAAYRRVLNLPLPEILPKPEERTRAEELWLRLKEFSAEERRAVVRVAEELQTWGLCERVCAESVIEASRDVERAAGLAQLAREIADRVVGSRAWRDRLRGYAAAHVANILRVSGELKAADAGFERAKRLWCSGSDPSSLLDPGRLLDLEASLRRDQRRLGEALALLEEAIAVGHSPARALVNKGFTLEVMGEPERAIEALLQAEALLENKGDQRLMNILSCNLGFSFCQAGRYAEAAQVAGRVGKVAIAMGDEILALRVAWLEGRIAAEAVQKRPAGCWNRRGGNLRPAGCGTTWLSPFWRRRFSFWTRGGSPKSRNWPAGLRRCSSPRRFTGRPWPPCGSSRKRRSAKRSRPSWPAAFWETCCGHGRAQEPCPRQPQH